MEAEAVAVQESKMACQNWSALSSTKNYIHVKLWCVLLFLPGYECNYKISSRETFLHVPLFPMVQNASTTIA